MNKKLMLALTLSTSLSALPLFAQEGTLFVEGGNVGIGVSVPTDKLHLSSGLLRVGGHTTGERVGHPTDFQITGLRNVIYTIDSDNNSTNASFIVSIDGDPNNQVLKAREDGRIRLNNASDSTTHAFVVGTNSTNGNGAHLTAGGAWVNASSRATKQDILDLGSEEALVTLLDLSPVKFRYRGEPGEDYVGFIAEDVPEMVAQSDRTTISPMDLVAVLTRVLQDQQRVVAGQQARIEELTTRMTELESEFRSELDESP